MKARRKPQSNDTYTTERRDAIELIAALLGGSTYRVPVEGKGSKPSLGTSDIAGAVGYMKNQLNRHTTMAVATRAGAPELVRIAAMAHRKIMRSVMLQQPPALDLRKGEDRWRLRLVAYDAVFELVWPERRQPFGELAKAAKMRKESYIRVHRCATAVLQDALNTGSQEFAAALWGRG